MRSNFKTTWTLEFSRRGPLVTAGGNAGLPRVEGTASMAITALSSGLANIPEGVANRAADVVGTYAEAHSRLAREWAPQDKGVMDATFSHDVEKTGLKATGRSRVGARYAVFVEMGFRHWRNGRFVRPKPFMFPAFAAVKANFLNDVAAIFKR